MAWEVLCKKASCPRVLCSCLGGGLTQGPHSLESVQGMSLDLALAKGPDLVLLQP